MTSLLVSASLNASRTHFIAVSKSTISPLRTPRDGACPTPKIFVVPSILLSPTTTQILDVPISNPTIKSLLAISFLLFWFPLVKRLRSVLIFFHRSLRQGFHHRRMHRNRFHDSRRLCRIDRVIDQSPSPVDQERNIGLERIGHFFLARDPRDRFPLENPNVDFTRHPAHNLHLIHLRQLLQHVVHVRKVHFKNVLPLAQTGCTQYLIALQTPIRLH